MNVLLIEDEAAAAAQLEALLTGLFPQARVLSVEESVRNSLRWLQSHPAPDLIISDIQLSDGTCFDLFRDTATSAPVLFTTAYDDYMQQAFKLHSIDYLLKPIDREELRAAIQKFLLLERHYQQHTHKQLQQLLSSQPARTQSYKSRFLIKTGDRLSTVAAAQVLFLRADERLTFLHDHDGQKFIIDESLDHLEKVLDPTVFFRLNRRYIVPISSVEKVQQHFNGRLHIRLKQWEDAGIFISREKVRAFKQWLGGDVG